MDPHNSRRFISNRIAIALFIFIQNALLIIINYLLIPDTAARNEAIPSASTTKSNSPKKKRRRSHNYFSIYIFLLSVVFKLK